MLVEGRELARALKIVRKAVNKRLGGVFACVRLQTDEAGRKLTVTADDCTTRIECVIPCKGTIDALVLWSELEPWVIAGDLLIERRDESTVELKTMDYEVTLETVSADVAVAGMVLRPLQGGIILTREDLDSIEDLGLICATDESRAFITNIRLNGSEFVATDTHRLGIVRCGKDLGMQHYIPKRLLRMTKAGIGPFTVRWGEGSIQVETASTDIRWTLFIDGAHLQFPNYGKVIPKPDFTTLTITLQADALSAALRQMVRVADSKRICAQVTGDSTLTLSCRYGANGRASYTINATHQIYDDPQQFFTEMQQVDWHVEPFAFNAAYMLDGLQFLGEDTVCLELMHRTAPICIRSASRDYVLMSMEAAA